MPPQVLPSLVDFERIEFELRHLGFLPISSKEVRQSIASQEHSAKRPRNGKEVGFSISMNGYKVQVWTTWLRGEGKARKEDTAWVLIVSDSGKSVYFSHPTHRTKHFVKNLLRKAWIARWRIYHRPQCNLCGHLMHIVSGAGLKSRYWKCKETSLHPSGQAVSLDWDHNLPPRAQNFVIKVRKKRVRDRKSRERRGIISGTPSILTRNAW